MTGRSTCSRVFISEKKEPAVVEVPRCLCWIARTGRAPAAARSSPRSGGEHGEGGRLLDELLMPGVESILAFDERIVLVLVAEQLHLDAAARAGVRNRRWYLRTRCVVRIERRTRCCEIGRVGYCAHPSPPPRDRLQPLGLRHNRSRLGRSGEVGVRGRRWSGSGSADPWACRVSPRCARGCSPSMRSP